MEKRQIEYFLEICDAGSYSAAARNLGVSQPALSQAVNALESELGVQLFYRQRTGAALTEDGWAFAPAAANVIRSFETASSVITHRSQELFGTLNIVCPASLVVDPLMGFVSDFKSSFPKVRLGLFAPRTHTESIQLVLSGAADCAILPDEHHPPGLEIKRLGKQSVVAIVGSMIKPIDNKITTLLRHGLICAPRGRSLRRMLEDAVGRTTVASAVVVETEHSGTIVPLVQAGVGVTFLSLSEAQQSHLLNLRIIEPLPAIERTIVLAYRKNDTSPELEAFLSIVDGSCESEPIVV